VATLIVLLLGTAWLSKAYGITAMDPEIHNYQSVLSILTTAVFGRGWFYYTTMGSVLLATSLSANTAFAGFPRLARAISIHDYLPHVFTVRGRRLLYSHGVYALSAFTAIILIAFGGVTDRLIPLYAIGAFLAFTLSQAGMVVHWMKMERHLGRLSHMFVNGFGAVATGITLIVVLVAKFMAGAWVTALLVAKFMAGAWVTALLVPVLIGLMMITKRHYARVTRKMKDMAPLKPDEHGTAAGGHSDGAVGPDRREGSAVRAAALEGSQGGARPLR